MCKALKPCTASTAFTLTVSLWSNCLATSEWPRWAAMLKACVPCTASGAFTSTAGNCSSCRTAS
eukprot:3487459-Amphidinium_carterae.1